MSIRVVALTGVVDVTVALTGTAGGFDAGTLSARKLDFSVGETENSQYLGVI